MTPCLKEPSSGKKRGYQELLDTFQDAGYTASLVTVEVGKQGMPNPTGFLKLRANLELSRSTLANLMVSVVVMVIGNCYYAVMDPLTVFNCK